jgi:MOSC domain-containing protein YiiM
MSARLIGIARRDKPRAPMEMLQSASVTANAGIEGDCRGVIQDRNVTLIFREDWEAACRDLGSDLPWVTRRANLLVEGLSGFKRVGAQLKVGSVLLEVTEENPPCGVMDILAEGLRTALQPAWRGGVACRVLQDGVIALGDSVAVVDQ